MSEIQPINDSDNLIPLKSSECTLQYPYVQSAITRISKQLTREAKRHKLTYDQLKRIFSNVRRDADIRVPKIQKKFLQLPSESDLARWFEVIKDPIHKLMFQTLVQTGLRVNELVHLEIKHLDLENNQALVVNGKGGKDRVIVIGNKLKVQLQIYLAGRKNRYLFETIRNSKFSKRRVQLLAEEYSAKCGVRIHCHLLRHIYNTRLAAQNLNEDQRGILAGHAKSSRSELQSRYTHLTLSGIKDKAIEAIDFYSL